MPGARARIRLNSVLYMVGGVGMANGGIVIRFYYNFHMYSCVKLGVSSDHVGPSPAAGPAGACVAVDTPSSLKSQSESPPAPA